MKRTIHYKSTEDCYVFFENDKNVFEINKKDLQFNVKAFYLAFYAEYQDYSQIELINEIEDNKEAKRVFDCVSSLVEKITQKLEELSPCERTMHE